MNTVKVTIGKLVSENSIVSREVMFRSDVSPAAAHKTTRLEKLVIGSFLIGQEYKPESVDGSDDGSGDPRSLPWGEWESYPYVIRHKGTEYVRLTPNEGDKPVVKFLADGQEVTREQFAAYLTPANARKLFQSSRPDCITVKMENIVSIQ